MSTSNTATRLTLLFLAGLIGLAILAVMVLHLIREEAEPQAAHVPSVNFESLTAKANRLSGFFDLYTDEKANTVLMALPTPDPETGHAGEAIYLSYLRTGLGSNPVGLDRGLGGDPHVVRFEVLGDRVHMTAPNTRFVARSSDAFERRATEESFARSVLWSAPVKARAEDGRILIDLAPLLTSDRIGVAERLARRGQGTFSVDKDRSAVLAHATLAFPDNVELEARVTFAGNGTGGEIRATAPSPDALTFTLHHSFVRLPDNGYRPRAADPRMGAIALSVSDYAAALDAPIESTVVLRHRLEKTDPNAERSTVKKPIVYYVDRGAPEPVRQALLDGARWWAEAFDAAGFIDGYRVELLPEDAHPLDARYNVIQWVHRQTRGWSYGNPIYDPRTGEIIKAVITLGSLRVRQDRMIFEGLTDVSRTGSGDPDDPIEIALARIRQLSAHEVGHGLGFVHNMAASAQDRASVMDYPAPLVSIRDDNSLDLSKAYGVGIGAWDIINIRYSYEQFAPGTDEGVVLADLAQEAASRYLYVADAHARPVSGAHPQGSVWDNGSNAIDELERVLAIRRIALSDFGLDNLPEGAPVSELRMRIVPIYLYHRYQIAAAAKAIGGTAFTYPVKGAPIEAMEPVSGAEQRRALEVLMRTVRVDTLSLPERLTALLPPRQRNWFSSRFDREEFQGSAYPLFDAQEAAVVAAGLTFDAVLHPDRLARVLRQSSVDDSLPSVPEVLGTLTRTVFDPSVTDKPGQLLQEAIAQRYVSSLIASAKSAEPVVSAALESHLTGLERSLGQSVRQDEAPGAMLAKRIRRYLDRPGDTGPTDLPKNPTPPGSPIGSGHACDTCWFCEDWQL